MGLVMSVTLLRFLLSTSFVLEVDSLALATFPTLARLLPLLPIFVALLLLW